MMISEILCLANYGLRVQVSAYMPVCVRVCLHVGYPLVWGLV